MKDAEESRVNVLLSNLRIAQASRRRPDVGLASYKQSTSPNVVAELEHNTQAPSGPRPPPSWSSRETKSSFSNVDRLSDNTWRSTALSLPLSFLSSSTQYNLDAGKRPQPASLLEFCVQCIVLADLPTHTPARYISSLPAHIRSKIARYAAIHRPLSSSALKALWGSDGHADGQAIIVGALHANERKTNPIQNHDPALPGQGVLPSEADKLLEVLLPLSDSRRPHDADRLWDEEDSWETIEDSHSLKPPLAFLILFQMPVSDNFLLRLPHTLTHLSLLSITSSGSTDLPISSLPRSLPLLRSLDISYNAPVLILRIVNLPWCSRWQDLKYLAMRGCWNKSDGSHIARRINEQRPGRWIEISL